MTDQELPGWNEKTSQEFIDYGAFFVPHRDEQYQIITELAADLGTNLNCVEICSGAGALCAQLLGSIDGARVLALDGSELMLQSTQKICADFSERLQTQKIDINDLGWRQFDEPVDFIYSSLAIHHLDGTGKQQLFADMAKALRPGGRFVVLDLIHPESPAANEIAARQWDDAVRTAALAAKRPDALKVFLDDHWNFYRDPDPDPIDQPSGLRDQLAWMVEAGFEKVDCHWQVAGHAIFSGDKPAAK